MEESANDVAELLLKLGVVEADELDRIPGLRASLVDRNEALKLGAGVRQRLGELLTEADRVVDEQISHSLLEQAKTGEKIGDILIRLGYLTLPERDVVLQFQRYQEGSSAGSDRLRLGRFLVSTGEISEGQLTHALEQARIAGRRIGEELVAEGWRLPSISRARSSCSGASSSPHWPPRYCLRLPSIRGTPRRRRRAPT